MNELLFYFIMLYTAVLAGVGFGLTVYEFRHNIVKSSSKLNRRIRDPLPARNMMSAG